VRPTGPDPVAGSPKALLYSSAVRQARAAWLRARSAPNSAKKFAVAGEISRAAMLVDRSGGEAQRPASPAQAASRPPVDAAAADEVGHQDGNWRCSLQPSGRPFCDEASSVGSSISPAPAVEICHKS
jgi:hypothetical protein